MGQNIWDPPSKGFGANFPEYNKTRLLDTFKCEECLLKDCINYGIPDRTCTYYGKVQNKEKKRK